MKIEKCELTKIDGAKMRWASGILPFAFCSLQLASLVFLIFLNALFPFPSSAADEWKQVTRPRAWQFPRDHGAHPAYRTEWWYFTGNLSDDAGLLYGYQLTFFRRGIRYALPHPSGPWDIRDVYLGHFAITDVGGKRFQYGERISRSGPGLAGAGTENMNVWVLNWSARMKDSTIALKAGQDETDLDLALIPQKPLVFHGRNGFSQKGPGSGQASYYTSFTHLETRGTLTTKSQPAPVRVKGTSWFDQEFGSNQLSPEQKGWDWFGLNLSDGRDLMIYLLRRSDGSIEPASSGTLIEADGRTRHLRLFEISVAVLDRWKSPRSGGQYPGRWRIRIPSARIDLILAPALADQELNTEGSTGVVYWEGATTGRGESKGRAVTCRGYAELTGYAGSLGGVF